MDFSKFSKFGLKGVPRVPKNAQFVFFLENFVIFEVAIAVLVGIDTAQHFFEIFKIWSKRGPKNKKMQNFHFSKKNIFIFELALIVNFAHTCIYVYI